jgi:hypothetical protein
MITTCSLVRRNVKAHRRAAPQTSCRTPASDGDSSNTACDHGPRDWSLWPRTRATNHGEQEPRQCGSADRPGSSPAGRVQQGQRRQKRSTSDGGFRRAGRTPFGRGPSTTFWPNPRYGLSMRSPTEKIGRIAPDFPIPPVAELTPGRALAFRMSVRPRKGRIYDRRSAFNRVPPCQGGRRDISERYHQGVGSKLICPGVRAANDNGPSTVIGCRSRLGGLLNFYLREAA